jgi:SnoaL-like domain
MLRLYDRLSASDVASFDQLVSQEPATLIIGTAPGEWVTERERMRFGFEAEGARIQAGEPAGYEEGSMGWVVDEPMFLFPDGSAMQTRLTAILHREDGAWKLVHMHVSGRRARGRGRRAAEAVVEHLTARQTAVRSDRRSPSRQLVIVENPTAG